MELSRRGLLLALGALGVAACGNPPRAYPAGSSPAGNSAPDAAAPTPFRSVVMVGDSITRASRNDLATAFTAMGIDDQTIDAEVGRRIDVGNGKGGGPLSGVRTVFNLLSQGLAPDVWVVALGTNDVGSYAGADDYGALIDQILGELPAEVPVVWQNTYRPQYLDHTLMFNDVLAQRIDARGNGAVVDWFAAASPDGAGLLRSDDLHPNTAGQHAMALLVAQALQRD